MTRAGFDATASNCVQADVWYKLWGNMTMNPVSAITGATCDRILDDPLVSGFCLAIMREAAAIGAKIGCPISQSGEDRNAVTRQLGAFKTSMLRDVEAGKPVELDALVSAVREIGEKTEHCDTQHRRAARVGALACEDARSVSVKTWPGPCSGLQR